MNNVVVLVVLALYALSPGEITLDPVRMSDPKLLLLGVGVTLGVITQAASLLPAIRRNNIDLRPLWGLDDRLKQFGAMATAIILYVLISQIGMIIANNISSHADAMRPDDLPERLAAAAVALRRPRRHPAHRDHAAAEPQCRRRRHSGRGGRPVRGDPPDHDRPDPGRHLPDHGRSAGRRGAVRLRAFRRGRRTARPGGQLVGVHAHPVRAGAHSSAGVLRPRAGVDADLDRPRHHHGQGAVLGAGSDDREFGRAGRDRAGRRHRSRVRRRRRDRRVPAASEPGRSAHGQCRPHRDPRGAGLGGQTPRWR